MDLDILLPVALFHKSNKPIEEHLHFVQNILESIEFYTDKKIHQVIDAIQQNLENNYTSYGAEHIMQKYTSHVSLILHDAIILASLENLGTDTAKNLVNKKA
ncbi:hypothetical protein KBC03_00990 [Patescibacteria group bacterium]|nr:hypothetical protein [Patescibacteria group bacterium]